MVFVHGGGVDHSTWDEHLEHFAPKHRVVAVDLRGHGQSDPAPAYTPDVFRDDLVAVIDATDPRKIGEIVIGTIQKTPGVVSTVTLLTIG